MSEAGNSPDEQQAFPRPKHFVLSPVEDGDYKRKLPTITAVYLGCEESPVHEKLALIDGACLDREQETKLQLHLFLPPAAEEVSIEDTETFAYELSSTKETMDEFWDCVMKIKSFVFAVSADTYYFRCRINTESSQITEMSCDLRLLN